MHDARSVIHEEPDTPMITGAQRRIPWDLQGIMDSLIRHSVLGILRISTPSRGAALRTIGAGGSPAHKDN